MTKTIQCVWIVLLLALAASPICTASTRLKDIVSIEGVRENQLVGYGVVVGLNGTGDKRQTFFSAQTLTNILQRMGVVVNPTFILIRNTAAVMVTATLPPFAQPGTKIDVSVAAVGDASNLQGGLLVLTPLRAANGQVYAAAQGSVITGGFVAGRSGNSRVLNHPTAGRVPSGAIVEQAPPSVEPEKGVHLQLHDADFITAARIVAAINKTVATDGPQIAESKN
jgi:flagellar P-ring protein precursor FlgI